MKREEHLDRLIESRERGNIVPSEENKEVAACLAAAETLGRLREITVPPVFARRLESHIRYHTRARELLQQNGTARQNGHSRQNGKVILPARLRQSARPQAAPRRRTLISALGVAATLILTCIAVLTVSARSLPGDPLYGVKQAAFQVKANLASDAQNRAEIKIDQLRSSLTDLSAVVSQGRDDRTINKALDILAANTGDSQAAVAALPAGSARDAEQQHLDSVVGDEKQTLRGLLDHLDWSMQLAFTHQLGVLGDPVPAISGAVVRVQSNGTLLIILAGAHFEPRAQFIFDGQAGANVSQVTPTQLVAVITYSAWTYGTHTFGVRNPDGSAAQTAYTRSNNNHEQEGGGRGGPGNHITPTPGGEPGDG